MPQGAPSSSWFPVGPSVILAHQSGLLLEYDIATAAPVGVVCPAPPGSTITLLDSEGKQSVSEDGSDVAVVRVTDAISGEGRLGIFGFAVEGRVA